MGSLKLPASGLVYVDTQILIYSAEKHPLYAPTLRTLWESVDEGKIEAVSSELTILETLVRPMRNKDEALISLYENLFRQPGLRLIPVTQIVLREATRLRASILGLRTPDAIHAATSILAECSLFLTNDKGFQKVPNLEKVILNDIVSGK